MNSRMSRIGPRKPLLLRESTGNAEAFFRINSIMEEAKAQRHLRSDSNEHVDKGLAALLASDRALSANPRAAYARWLSNYVTAAGPSSHLMSVTPQNVHVAGIDPNIFVMYKNRDCIADIVSPVVNAARMFNIIQQAPSATLQNIANTRIANSRAKPNQINWNVDNSLQYSCVPVGLIDYIPAEVLANADSSPLENTGLWMAVIREFMDLARE